MPSATTVRPLYVQVDPDDTVAILVNEGGLRAGTRFDSGLTLIDDVPEAHKVALVDMADGAPILRYGSVIGYADGAIAKGSWVHEERMRLPVPPSLMNLPLATQTPAKLLPLEGYTFEGYLNDDGSVGTKNMLGITTTVQCVAATVDYAVQRIKAEMLPRYPNVDDVIAITHPYGCGVALDAPGAEIPVRTLQESEPESEPGRRADGGEPGVREAAAGAAAALDTLPILSEVAYIVRMQDEQHHSFGDIVAAIMEMAERRLEQLNRACGGRGRRRTWWWGCSAAAAMRSPA